MIKLKLHNDIRTMLKKTEEFSWTTEHRERVLEKMEAIQFSSDDEILKEITVDQITERRLVNILAQIRDTLKSARVTNRVAWFCTEKEQINEYRAVIHRIFQFTKKGKCGIPSEEVCLQRLTTVFQ